MSTLKDVIDDIILEQDDHNSLFRHARRTHIRSLAKRGLSKLKHNLKGNVRAISFKVPPNQTFDFPDDYEDYIRVSVKEDCKIYPIRYNDTLPAYVEKYLQDANNGFIYDCHGDIKEVESVEECRHENKPKECNKCEHLEVQDMWCDYWFKVADEKFWFSPELEGKTIIIEYISSGITDSMDECSIKIKKSFHEPLIAWIKWQYLRSVESHMGRIEEHRREFNRMKKSLKEENTDFTHEGIIRILDHRFKR